MCCYEWLRQYQQNPEVATDWKWIWKLAVPEKIRTFIWSCLHDALPVNSNRFKCHLAVTAACSRCSSPVEDGIHALRECPHSRELWGKIGAGQWNQFWNLDFNDWIHRHGRGAHAVEFIVGLWSIWKWRCNMCLDPEVWTLERAWRKHRIELDAVSRFHQPARQQGEQGNFRLGWRAPPRHYLKLNVDGSYHADEDCMGSGGVIRNDSGSWVVGFLSHNTHGNPFMAEALALREGLIVAWNHGARNVLCELDCRELVNALKRPTHTNLHAQTLVLSEICSLLNRNWRVEVYWIPREENAAADWLAKEACCRHDAEVCLLPSPPLALEIILLKDVLGLI